MTDCTQPAHSIRKAVRLDRPHPLHLSQWNRSLFVSITAVQVVTQHSSLTKMPPGGMIVSENTARGGSRSPEYQIGKSKLELTDEKGSEVLDAQFVGSTCVYDPPRCPGSREGKYLRGACFGYNSTQRMHSEDPFS